MPRSPFPPMKLEVVHRTHYTSAEPVTESFNEVRLQPITADGQVCHSFILKVLPSSRLSHYLDFYFNCVHFFEIPEQHDMLSIESISSVTTSARLITDGMAGAPLTRLPECAQMEKCFDFLQPSQYVATTADVWRLALDAIEGEKEIWSAANAIMRFVHKNFTYTPQATNVKTHMLEVLNERRGVCQDFAHVMLGMCRAIQIPARYVSGYLYNGGGSIGAGQELLGAQGSHAWCEVFVPDIGWCSLDPTNNQQADERYVKVAVGKDYTDILPIRGHYRGTPAKKMTVGVSVTR